MTRTDEELHAEDMADIAKWDEETALRLLKEELLRKEELLQAIVDDPHKSALRAASLIHQGGYALVLLTKPEE